MKNINGRRRSFIFSYQETNAMHKLITKNHNQETIDSKEKLST